MGECQYCGKSFFLNTALYGHYARCREYMNGKYLRAQQEARINRAADFDDREDEYYDVEDVLHGDMQAAIQRYLLHQHRINNLSAIEDLETGYVQLLNSEKDLADLEVYVRLCQFVYSCTKVSISEADDMIKMIKQITHINGKEIPVPKSFKK